MPSFVRVFRSLSLSRLSRTKPGTREIQQEIWSGVTFIELAFTLNCLEIDEISKELILGIFGTLSIKIGSWQFSGESPLQEREILYYGTFFPDKKWISVLLK